MNLEQINLSYDLIEDRMIMKIGFASEASEHAGIEKQEIQIYLTRRFLIRFWPGLMKAMEMQISLDRPDAAFASQDMMQMEHQQSVQEFSKNGNFASDYESQRATPVWGKHPILLESINFHLNPKQSICIEFIPSKATNNQAASAIEVKLPSSMLHGLCKLIQDAAVNAEWELNLELPGANSNSDRVLN